MLRWLWVTALAAAACGCDNPSSAEQAKAPLEPRVVAQAQVVPVDGIIEVRPLIEGKVLRVLVQPGDRVEADQLLAEIESDLPGAAVKQRQADAKAASERLSLAEEGVRPEDREALAAAAEAARNEAELAQDRWQRQRRLFEKGFVSDQSVIEAERSAVAAKARAREAEMRAKAGSAGGRPAEVRAAREQVASANAVLNQGRVVLSRTRIFAPIGGVVMTRNVNPGDIIGADALQDRRAQAPRDQAGDRGAARTARRGRPAGDLRPAGQQGGRRPGQDHAHRAAGGKAQHRRGRRARSRRQHDPPGVERLHGAGERRAVPGELPPRGLDPAA